MKDQNKELLDLVKGGSGGKNSKTADRRLSDDDDDDDDDDDSRPPRTEWEKEREMTRRHDEKVSEQQRRALLAEDSASDASADRSDDARRRRPSGSRDKNRESYRRSDSSSSSRRHELDKEKSASSSQRRRDDALQQLRSDIRKKAQKAEGRRARSGDESDDAAPRSEEADTPSDGTEDDDDDDDDDDVASDDEESSSRRRKSSRRPSSRDRQRNEQERSDKRRMTSEGTSVALKRRRHNDQVPLFCDEAMPDTQSQQVQRRMKRALNEITFESLDLVRVGAEKLFHILEHPKAASYLAGAFVRLPRSSESQDLLSASRLRPVPVSTDATALPLSGYFVAQILSTKFPDGPLKVHSATITVDGFPEFDQPTTWRARAASAEPFTHIEVEWLRHLLRQRDVADVEELAKGLTQKLLHLRSFTFTDEDVELILQRKQNEKSRSAGNKDASVAKDSNAGGDGASDGDYKSLLRRKADLTIQVDGMKSELQSADLNARDRSQKLKQLSAAESSLHTVQKSLLAIKSQQQQRNRNAGLDSVPGGMYGQSSTYAGFRNRIPTTGFGTMDITDGISALGRGTPKASLSALAHGARPSGARSSRPPVVNPYARRECRPVPMFQTSSSKGSSVVGGTAGGGSASSANGTGSNRSGTGTGHVSSESGGTGGVAVMESAAAMAGWTDMDQKEQRAALKELIVAHRTADILSAICVRDLPLAVETRPPLLLEAASSRKRQLHVADGPSPLTLSKYRRISHEVDQQAAAAARTSAR